LTVQKAAHNEKGTTLDADVGHSRWIWSFSRSMARIN
jgi:hypothetical protein